MVCCLHGTYCCGLVRCLRDIVLHCRWWCHDGVMMMVVSCEIVSHIVCLPLPQPAFLLTAHLPCREEQNYARLMRQRISRAKPTLNTGRIKNTHKQPPTASRQDAGDVEPGVSNTKLLDDISELEGTPSASCSSSVILSCALYEACMVA